MPDIVQIYAEEECRRQTNQQLLLAQKVCELEKFPGFEVFKNEVGPVYFILIEVTGKRIRDSCNCDLSQMTDLILPSKCEEGSNM